MNRSQRSARIRVHVETDKLWFVVAPSSSEVCLVEGPNASPANDISLARAAHWEFVQALHLQ